MFPQLIGILEYGDVLWSGACDYELAKLDRVHIRAMRIITGATERSHINSLYEDLGWTSLATRRKKHRLKWFYKITNGMSPEYLRELIPPTVGERADTCASWYLQLLVNDTFAQIEI